MEEVAENVRQVMFIFDGRGAVRGDQIKCSERRFCKVWRFTLDHLNGHDTQTPDVDLAAILLASDYFRCHPVGCADHGVPLVVCVVDLGAEAKVGCMKLALTFNKVTGKPNLLSLMLPSNDKRMLSDLISR